MIQKPKPKAELGPYKWAKRFFPQKWDRDESRIPKSERCSLDIVVFLNNFVSRAKPGRLGSN